jgi:hypothetical protein
MVIYLAVFIVFLPGIFDASGFSSSSIHLLYTHHPCIIQTLCRLTIKATLQNVKEKTW